MSQVMRRPEDTTDVCLVQATKCCPIVVLRTTIIFELNVTINWRLGRGGMYNNFCGRVLMGNVIIEIPVQSLFNDYLVNQMYMMAKFMRKLGT